MDLCPSQVQGVGVQSPGPREGVARDEHVTQSQPCVLGGRNGSSLLTVGVEGMRARVGTTAAPEGSQGEGRAGTRHGGEERAPRGS